MGLEIMDSELGGRRTIGGNSKRRGDGEAHGGTLGPSCRAWQEADAGFSRGHLT